MKKKIKKVEAIAREFFAKMGLDIETDTKVIEEVICLNVKPKEEGSTSLLIGYHGENLGALQHVLRMLANKVLGEPTKVMIDIDGYKERQKESIIEMTRKIAARVKRTGRVEILRPMNGYERRIVHLALTEFEGVATESVGEDPNRRVMVKIEK